MTARRRLLPVALLALALVAAVVQIAQMRRGVPGPHGPIVAVDLLIGAYAAVAIARRRGT